MLELVLVNCFSLVPVTSKSLNNMQFKNQLIKYLKFYLKQIILIFWTKFNQIGYFRSDIEKVNSVIEFSIFDLV